MADLQIQGKKIALLDSSNNTVYTLPDSAGSSGNAMVADGSGGLDFGGINLDAVLSTGDSSSRNLKVNKLKVDVLDVGSLIDKKTTFFPGDTEGYISGGLRQTTLISSNSPPNFTNAIQKFPFATDANAVGVGFLTQSRDQATGHSSTSHGYTAGGQISAMPAFNDGTGSNTIDKFPFAVGGGAATDVGDLDVQFGKQRAAAISTTGYGISAVGQVLRMLAPDHPNFPNAQYHFTQVDKFPFATDTNATNVGDMDTGTNWGAGYFSGSHGYISSSFYPSAADIRKFPTASELVTQGVGFLSVDRQYALMGNGISSDTHGYNAGGYAEPANANDFKNIIDKFPFAADTNSQDVGDLTVSRAFSGGLSSTTNGYVAGGKDINSPFVSVANFQDNTIDKFPFATDANATDVGNLVTDRTNIATQQV